MAIEIVDLPIDSMVDLSIAMLNYQRVYIIYITQKKTVYSLIWQPTLPGLSCEPSQRTDHDEESQTGWLA